MKKKSQCKVETGIETSTFLSLKRSINEKTILQSILLICIIFFYKSVMAQVRRALQAYCDVLPMIAQTYIKISENLLKILKFPILGSLKKGLFSIFFYAIRVEDILYI